MALTTAQIQNAYVAFFNRPDDNEGLRYWGSYAGSSADLLNTFAQSAEYKSLYSGMNNTQLVGAVYQNLFGHAPDVSGLEYWVDNLSTGKLSIGNIADAINKGALSTDATIIANKVAAATAFTAALDTTAEQVAYAGVNSTGLAAVKAWLAAVTSDAATVPNTDSVNTIIKTVQSNVGGNAFSLTVGADQQTANVFNAYSVVTQLGAQVDTLQSTDVLTGSGSNPTLNVTIATATIATPSLSGIETLNLSPEGAARTVNLANATGVKTINVDNSQQSLTVKNVAALADVGVKAGDGVADTLVQFADSVVAGTADSIKLILQSNGNADLTSGQVINVRGTSTGGFETLNITATGANRVDEILSDSTAVLGGAATGTNSVKTINVSGDGSLRVDTALTTTTTFDASANKGGVNVKLDNAGAITIKGGDGADTFNLAATLTNADKVDGGAGRDTLATTSAIITGNQISNIEVLRNDGMAPATVFDNDDATGIDAIVHNSSNTATYQDMVGANAADASKGLTLQGTGAVTFNIKNATGLGASSDALYVNVGSAKGTTGVNAAGGAAADGLTTTGTETLTVNVVANNTAANTATGLGGITADGSLSSITLKGGAASTAFSLGTLTSTTAALTNIDGSAFLGDLTIAGTAVSQIIKGGAGNDALSTGGRTTYTAGVSADVLTGGAGKDTFTFETSAAASTADTILTGANLTAIDGNASAYGRMEIARITDLNLGGDSAGTKVDTIKFVETPAAAAATLADASSALTSITVVNGGAATAMTGADLGTAVNAIVSTGGVLATSAGGGKLAAGLFTWGGDTYLIASEQTAVNDTFGNVAGRDIIIKVTGVTGTLDASDFI